MTIAAPLPASLCRRAVLRRLRVGSLTVLVLLGVSRGGTAAAPITISQHAFVRLCKDTGGTPTRVSTNVVQCSYPDGATSTCNFVTKQCTDYIPPEITPGGNPNASPISGGDVPSGGVFSPADGAAVAATPPQPHPGRAPHRHGHRRRA